jgi:hypothetical protein
VGALRLAAECLLVAAVLLAARSEAARALLPVLGLFRGLPGYALAALTAGYAAARLGLRPAPPRPPTRVLLAAATLLFSAVGLYYAERLQASGDEPHYLIMAQSLWQEGDLDLRDNYARKDFLDYTPGPLSPHYGAPRADGRPFPAHSPGLPALLAPAYAAGGRSACVLVMAFLAAALGAEVYRLAARSWPAGDAPLLAWATMLGGPVAFYAFHIYTEVPSALALLLALRLVGEGGTGRAAAAALLAGLLPWLHVKMVPAAAVVGVFGLLRLAARPRLAFAAVSALMAAAFLWHYQRVFGEPTPLAIYGGVPRDARSDWWRAALGLSLDRSYGLLPFAPVFLLGAAGVGRLLRGADRRRAHLAAAAAVVVPVLVWRMWWGGFCPPGRFLVPALPVLALAVAARVAASGRGLARWRWALVGLGLALSAYLVHRPVDRLLLDRRAQPTRVWQWLGGFEEPTLNRYLPSLVSRDPEELRVAAVWAAGLGLLLALDVAAQRRRSADALFRSLALPLCLAVAGGAAIDRWARSVGDGKLPASAALPDGPQGLPGAKGQLQHLLDGGDEVEPHVGLDVRRDVLLDGLLVAPGEDDLLDPHPMGRQHLLLDPAHREHPAGEGDLARHRHPGAHPPLRQERDERSHQGHAG